MNDGIGDAYRRSPPGVFIHPDDALRLGLVENEHAIVESKHGAIEAVVRIDDSLAFGCVNIPHGFEETNVGHLTSDRIRVDELSGMPELSALAVRIKPA